MSKYIVKNCPAIINCMMLKNSCSNADGYCKDYTNCLIKQVIEKCKKPEQVYRNYDNPLTQVQCNTLFGRITLGNEILQLFDIEECTDEN